MGHLQRAGFPVTLEDRAELRPIKRQYQVPDELEACHTAVVEGYVIEGHVPADLISRLLRERPRISGLAVPGMPPGSPGMEASGGRAEAYRVVMFDRGQTVGTYATRAGS